MEKGINTTMNKPGLSYKDAGVDIDAGNDLVDAIKPLAKSTTRSGVVSGLGGFGALFDLKAAGYDDPILVSGTDGVGTKLMVAMAADTHDTIGIDLVAMCVNDLVVQGAEPLFFLDYFATGKLSVEAGRAIVSGIAEGCKQANCALIGGETAEMPGMYDDGHYDLAGFSVGAVERSKLLAGDVAKPGDVLLGLGSNGVHSNGYSLVRKIVEKSGLPYDADAPFEDGKTLGQALLTPTRIYVKSCLAAHKTGGVKAISHITGGGLYENIPRVLPKEVKVEIDCAAWDLPPVFQWLMSQGNVAAEEMARTFNCGLGMVIAVEQDKLEAVETALADHGETVTRIGAVEARSDDEAQVVLKGLDTWQG